MTTDVLLEFADVAFRYPDGNAGLADCSLAIARGSICLGQCQAHPVVIGGRIHAIQSIAIRTCYKSD